MTSAPTSGSASWFETATSSVTPASVRIARPYLVSVGAGTALDELHEATGHELAVSRVDELDELSPEQLGLGEAEDSLDRLAVVGDPAVAPDQPDQVVALPDERSQPPLAAGQRLALGKGRGAA